MSAIILNVIRRQCVRRISEGLRQQVPPAWRREFCMSFPSYERALTKNDFTLDAKHHPDQFGNLSPQVDDPERPDAGDVAEETFLKYPPSARQKLSVVQYAELIKGHLKNQRIKEALDVLEVRMKEDRVKPVNYHFNLLIGGCARIGYSKKAFQLYNKMKQHGLKVTGGTYTSLFNACANSPFLEDGIGRADRLREIMLEKGYEPNASNYNAMIKAYGRGGKLQIAFQLVDEMCQKRLAIGTDTFNFLLQACISDGEHGFRHALLVWHRMHRMRAVPDRYSFNLLLRCVRDCQMGDLETTQQVLEQILVQHPSQPLPSPPSDGSPTLPIPAKQSTVELQTVEHAPEGAPDLLSPSPHLGSLISLGEIRKPEDRLLLLGGATGVLREMERCGATPDIRTMTELLDVIPPTYAAEKQLLNAVRRLDIRCDIDFFNILIKKRSMRFDYAGARDVLELVKIAHLEPDIVTYGVLALGCQTPEEARSLLKEMRSEGIRVNIQILGAMLRQGCVKRNFRYVTDILDIVQRERIKPNEDFLRHLELFNKKCDKQDKGYDRSKQKPGREEFKLEYNRYRMQLDSWKEKMGLHGLAMDDALGVVREHPWEQFKQPQAEGFEALKNPKRRHEKKKRHSIRKVDVDAIETEQPVALLK